MDINTNKLFLLHKEIKELRNKLSADKGKKTILERYRLKILMMFLDRLLKYKEEYINTLIINTKAKKDNITLIEMVKEQETKE